jgi:hypothetical protein
MIAANYSEEKGEGRKLGNIPSAEETRKWRKRDSAGKAKKKGKALFLLLRLRKKKK